MLETVYATPPIPPRDPASDAKLIMDPDLARNM
jgi:hypothetical protein